MLNVLVVFENDDLRNFSWILQDKKQIFFYTFVFNWKREMFCYFWHPIMTYPLNLNSSLATLSTSLITFHLNLFQTIVHLIHLIQTLVHLIHFIYQSALHSNLPYLVTFISHRHSTLLSFPPFSQSLLSKLTTS